MSSQPKRPIIKTERFRPPTKSRTLRSNRIREAIRASQSKRLQGINELRQIHETKQVQRLKVKIIAVIWGHGSLTQTPFENRFNERIKLNMFGLGVSGCSTWLNRDFSNYVNKGLSSGQILDDKLLTKINNVLVSWDAVYKFEPNTTSAITSHGTTHSVYATVKDFGRGRKKRSDKIFAGEDNPEAAARMYPDDMIAKIAHGPVLRIYQIVVTNELGEIIEQQISPVDIVIPNYSRLANIQEAIIKFVDNLTMHPSSSKFEIPAGTLHDIELDLFDTTCNYTEKEPVLAYLENKMIRKYASQGKTQKFRPNPNRIKHPLPLAKHVGAKHVGSK